MKRDRTLLVLRIAAVLMAVVAVFAGIKLLSALQERSAASEETLRNAGNEREWGGTVTHGGKTYKRRADITTILLLGIDGGNPGATAAGSGGRSDAIVFLFLDDTARTAQILSVPRDTMTDVDIYDHLDLYRYSAYMQVAMQYAHGSSPARGCYITKKTLSRMLYGMRIDGCLSLEMDGISVITDMMGGITLTMPEDYSDVDPAYTKGATITLNGDEMEHFIRYRQLEHGQSVIRMDRQNWLMTEMVRQLQTSGMSSFLEKVLDKAEAYIESDIDGDTIKKLSDYRFSDETLTLPGNLVAGNFHDEYYLDEEALQELLLKLLYEEK